MHLPRSSRWSKIDSRIKAFSQYLRVENRLKVGVLEGSNHHETQTVQKTFGHLHNMNNSQRIETAKVAGRVRCYRQSVVVVKCNVT
jgi:hypothetical protein